MPTAAEEITPIRVVCATRSTEADFFVATQAGRSLAAFASASNSEVRVFAENLRGLSEIYNQAIDEVVDTPRILMFLHDDCLITDFFWADRVRAGLTRFDLVGVVGNRRRIQNQPSWIIADLTGKQDDYANLSGAIGQGMSMPPQRFDYFGPPGNQCKLLDGVLLATHSGTLQRSGLRFDPRFRFHFYDMDFCRSAELLDLRMGTIPLSVVHASTGSLDDAWFSAYQDYMAKWK